MKELSIFIDESGDTTKSELSCLGNEQELLKVFKNYFLNF